ncbi:hypothetical protein [Campylobacter hominis]|uniref:Uncharacterized protein n=1 Tax=Campylobacter hominis (strain ATCC BAA-381 / DSM 21671 / CCUG 45161 / LMG 19568 / NCTC 13146 / CH001A) TaxID=360107 RepID=A7I3H5_CAMHC|nr:hypothetical protein [Campylobacter hominis]ABS51812.1 hypothetical protein CHAB381_1533 [Campylobacter hominis ATCC BAA-381]SUW85577.1 putative adenylate kinase (ATP-AMP transphosphorylase) [Campylobacter hominis]
MNYIFGIIIICGGIAIFVDPNPAITPFGIPKGDTIPYGLNIPVGIVVIILGLVYIYIEMKKMKFINFQLNKFVYILCGIVFIISGFEIYITKKFTFHYYEPLYLGNYSILAGLVFIVAGLLLIIYTPKHSDFMRCKKCHKVYNYVDVKDKNKICPNAVESYKITKNLKKKNKKRKTKNLKELIK